MYRRVRGLCSRRLVLAGMVGWLLMATACSDAPATSLADRSSATTSATSEAPEVAGVTSEAATVHDVDTSVGTEASVTTIGITVPATTIPTTTAVSVAPPAARSMGVVLIDPAIPDVLNLRERAGAGSPIIGTLHPTQTKLSPTGRQEAVDGRTWHEIVAGDTVGWVHGRYVTETWTLDEVEARWDWETALDTFATALRTGEGLAEAVSWRGLYVIHHDNNLRWWKPARLVDLLTDDTKLAWSSTGASAEEMGPTASFKEQIADRFLADYHDGDVQLEPGGVPIGAGGVLPPAAVSPALANFVWIAVHDPEDNPEYGGIDWSTWFVFMELEGALPRVVGLQVQTWYP